MKHFKRYSNTCPTWLKVGNKVYNKQLGIRMLIKWVDLRYDGKWTFGWDDLDDTNHSGYVGDPIPNQFKIITHFRKK